MKMPEIKARTVFSFMIYATWCFGCIVEIMAEGKRVPEPLHAIVAGQMVFYYGQKVAERMKIKSGE